MALWMSSTLDGTFQTECLDLKTTLLMIQRKNKTLNWITLYRKEWWTYVHQNQYKLSTMATIMYAWDWVKNVRNLNATNSEIFAVIFYSNQVSLGYDTNQ